MIDDLLLTTPGAPTDTTTYRALVGVVGRYGGGDLVAAMCHGSCYGHAEPTSIVRSRDGGIT